jgi:hypothetical protein
MEHLGSPDAVEDRDAQALRPRVERLRPSASPAETAILSEAKSAGDGLSARMP